MSWGKLCIIFMRKYYVQCRHVMRKSCSLKLCFNCIKILKTKMPIYHFPFILKSIASFTSLKIATIIGVRWCNETFIPKDHRTVIMNCYFVMPESIFIIFWCIFTFEMQQNFSISFLFDNVRCQIYLLKKVFSNVKERLCIYKN